MRGVIVFLLVLAGILLFATVASAYHSFEYAPRRVSYIQTDTMMISSPRVIWEYHGAPRAMPMYRTRFMDDISYPRYVTNRRSGKVYYASEDVVYESIPAYQPFRACPSPLVLC